MSLNLSANPLGENHQQILHLPKKLEETPILVSVIEVLPKHIQEELRDVSKLTETRALTMFAKHETASDYEDILELLFQKLPKEIADRKIQFYKKNPDITLLEAIENSLTLFQDRSELWKFDGDQRYYEEIKETVEIFENAKNMPELFKGRGNAGFVFQVPEVKEVCIKFLHSPEMQRYSIDREFGIQCSAYEISKQFKILKIPEPHAVAVHSDNTKSFFTMETVDGMTLLQLVEFPGERKNFLARCGSEGFSESYLISLLSDPQILKNAQHDIETLHKNDVVHGDIHPRNIMIDTKGNLYLIDFGNAVIPTNLAPGVDYSTIENTKDLDSTSINTSFDITAKQLKKQAESQD